MSKVIILGTGPAGMLAGYAAERNGHDVMFYSRPGRSLVLEGSYLMRPLPELHVEGACDDVIAYIPRGTAEGYARKVYGDPAAPVSWEHVAWGADRPLWWLLPVYEKLYDRYEGNITTVELTPMLVEAIGVAYELVINTVPLPVICTRPRQHHFFDVDITLVRVPANHDKMTGANMMLYNGEDDFPWFKFTRSGEWDTWEYGPHLHSPLLEYAHEAYQTSEGKKLISNTCDCHPRIHRVGRWGQWQRGVLNHHPFEQTQALLASVGLGKGA